MLVLGELEQQLKRYFEQLAKGQDVSPAQRYRLEGYLHACIDANLVEPEFLQRLMRDHAQNVFQSNGVELVTPESAPLWQLPYRVAIAPVNTSA